MDGPTGGDASERSLGQVEGGIFGCGESRGRIWRASGEYSPVDCHGPGGPGGGVAVEDAGSGAEEAAERDWGAVGEAEEAGSTRRRGQDWRVGRGDRGAEGERSGRLSRGQSDG